MPDACGTYPLDHSLLKESWRNDTLTANETIRVDQCTTDNASKDYAEAASEHLRKISNDSASCHGAQVGNNLCYSDSVSRETILIGQHRWVQILASV